MFTVIESATFKSWLNGLNDIKAQDIISIRLRRVSLGNLGDAKSVGGGVSELRINCGPRYRVYFTRRGLEVILLLCGGDKGTQARDIKLAQKMVSDLRKEK